MTAIVAISYPGGALMAGDAAGCSGDLVLRERSPKVARRQGYLVGAAGDAYGCMAAMHDLDVAYSGGGLAWWAHTHMVPALRSALERGKLGDDTPIVEVLLAAPGELVLIDGAGGVADVFDDYMAAGSGGAVALGALAVTRGVTPARRAKRALRAATRHVVGVSRPWSYVTTAGTAGQL